MRTAPVSRPVLPLLAVLGLVLGAGLSPVQAARGKMVRTAAASRVRRIEHTPWKTEGGGKLVELYTLTNKNGLVAKITSFGATLVEMHVPDHNGKLGDVVLGYDTVADYENGRSFFGGTVGRVANRIAGSAFQLDGKTYKLAANEDPDHLHGGVRGWNKVVWDAVAKDTPAGPSVELTYLSKDGEEGYPGNVRALVRYTLTDANELRVEMEATTDKPTAVNMAHHSYWNLHHSLGGDIRDHVLTINADAYTPGMLPDGRVAQVAGTPFDFNRPKPISKDLNAAGPPVPGAPAGYDHNFLVSGKPDQLRFVARVEDPRTGRVMTLEANQPGVQLYTGLWLDGSTKGKGQSHVQYGGLCLETQQPPNSVNVPAWKDGVILRPGQTYRHVMVHRFSTTR